jgi:acetylornithine/N-succinyldiaminopimelate aminotransferase
MTTALMNTYGHRDLTLVRGQGCRVWDNIGNDYLDAFSGVAVCGLGHCHPAVTRAIVDQTAQLLHASNWYNLVPQQQAAEKLQSISGLDKVFFANSGAEANEAAIKIARKVGNSRGIKLPTIITMKNAFHGRTLATLTATGSAKVTDGFQPLVEGFRKVSFNDISAVEALSSDPNIVAVMLEPIQGEGGIHIADKEYLNQLRALCDRQQWLLILDEVQSGNGRSGRYFAYQHLDWTPDILTTAKGLGNGIPIGACLAKNDCAEVLQPGNHGSTYGGNPVACAAANAVMDTILTENLCQQAANMGQYLADGFASVFADKHSVVDIRQKGLLIGIELDHACGNLTKQAATKGLLINVTAGNVIRLLPPLIISQSEADQIIQTLGELIT